MANETTLLDEWSVRDLEDNSSLTVTVFRCTELGNRAQAGLQVKAMGRIANFEPDAAERWAYLARKQGGGEYLLESESWTAHADQFIRISFVAGSPAKAKVAVKTRSSKIHEKEYDLPFSAE